MSWIAFLKIATNCRALLRKMTYIDEASYKSSPPCTWGTAVLQHKISLPEDCCTTTRWLLQKVRHVCGKYTERDTHIHTNMNETLREEFHCNALQHIYMSKGVFLIKEGLHIHRHASGSVLSKTAIFPKKQGRKREISNESARDWSLREAIV